MMETSTLNLNQLWTEHLRKAVNSEKLRLLIEAGEEIIEFLTQCEITRVETIGEDGYYHIQLTKGGETLFFNRQYYANVPSTIEFKLHTLLEDFDEDKTSAFLIKWFNEIQLHYCAIQHEVVPKYGGYLQAFLRHTQTNIAEVGYLNMNKDGDFVIVAGDKSYIVIHKSDLLPLAKKKMIQVMYADMFSNARISYKKLTKVSGMTASTIKEMYNKGKGETLDQEQADEFLGIYADLDAYFEIEFENWGYAGLIGNKKFGEDVICEYHIFRKI